MKAHQATTSATTIAAAGVGRPAVTIVNVSDTVVYLKWDASATTITTALGVPLAINGSITIPGGDRYAPAITCIHAGVGNKELRVMGVD